MSVSHSKQNKILYNCYFSRSQQGEQFIPEHVFSFQVSGTLTITDGEKKYVFKEGDFRLSRRNRLAKFIKEPPENGEFKSISIYLDQNTLQNLSKEFGKETNSKSVYKESVITLTNHPLYKSFMDSILIYLQYPEEEQQAIIDLKLREAVQLLLKVNPEVRDVLFDFNEPGKIDLEAFMLRNFRFNVSLNRFAYLTGRSLSTFKRDFEKIYKLSPNRWLVKKRLEYAKYLILEKGKTPSDVYIEVGFEDLSHFSYAFKKVYGIAPSRVGH